MRRRPLRGGCRAGGIRRSQRRARMAQCDPREAGDSHRPLMSGGAGCSECAAVIKYIGGEDSWSGGINVGSEVDTQKSIAVNGVLCDGHNDGRSEDPAATRGDERLRN